MNIKTEVYHRYNEVSPRAIFTESLLLILDNEKINYANMNREAKRILRKYDNPEYFYQLMENIIIAHCDNITIIQSEHRDTMLGVYTYDLVEEIENTIITMYNLSVGEYTVRNSMLSLAIESICWDNVTLHYYNKFIENFNYRANTD